MRRRARTIAITFVAALAVIAACRRYLPSLLSPYRFEDDACQHVWWTYRFADPGLFPNDPAAAFFSRLTFAPPGYQAIARAFVPFVDAQTLCEVVPFVLTALVAVLAWACGRTVSGGSTLGATAAASFALLGGVLARVESGLPRAWAMPVLLLGLWAVLARRWAAFGLSLVLAAVFYPPLIVNLGAVGGIVFCVDLIRARRFPRGSVALVLLGALAILAVLAAYRDPKPDAWVGPRPTGAEARAMPEFGPDGRSWFFSPDPVAFYVSNQRSGLGMEPSKLTAAVLVLVAGLVLFPRSVPPAVWLVPVTSLAGYIAAHAVLFKLHLPSRYTRFTLPAFMMLWLAAMLPRVLERVRRLRPIARVLDLLARPPAMAALALLALGGLTADAALKIRRDLGRQPLARQAEVLGFLATLPKDALIAAHPTDASAIPLLTRRSVLASEETSTPYDLAYYGEMKRRISAELEACYASSWSAVDSLFDRYGVTAFMVNLDRYRRPVDPDRAYFEPFRSGIREAIERGAKGAFVLEDPPANRVLFRSGPFLVVRVGKKG